MDRIAIFLAAVIPALLILEYGVARTRGSWTNEALWTAFMVGAVGALGIAIIEVGLTVILDAGRISGLPYAAAQALLIAAIPEETIKFVVLLGVAERHVDARRRQDVVLLALAVGLGFAAMENLFHLLAPGASPSVAAVRAVTSVPGHGINGLVMGAFLTLARLDPKRRKLLLSLSLIAPIVLHAAYDFPLFAMEASGLNGTVIWAPALWIVVLIGSAMAAIALTRRALSRAVEADRLSGRDARPVAGRLPLLWRGLVLVVVSPCAAVAGAYLAKLSPVWLGAITSIVPVALGVDMITARPRRSRSGSVVLETKDLPVGG